MINLPEITSFGILLTEDDPIYRCEGLVVQDNPN